MFKTKRTIEFSMCDTAGILFFARIFELFHSAYEEFILSSKFDEDYFEHDELAIPLIRIDADFKAPIKLHETIKIFIGVTEVKNSTFELTTYFIDLKEKTRAIVKSVHIFVEKKNFSKIKIPSDFEKLLLSNQD